MKFKRHMKLEQGLRQIDVAPLLNMMFLLLIFFMLTSNFVLQPGLRVSLPRAVTSEAVSSEHISLVVSGENTVYFNGVVVATADLKRILGQAAKRSQPVLIKADSRAALGRVVELWDMARDAGVSRINLATNQEKP